ncbi:MAG: hypothetical protein ACRYF2_18085 [Janthinobacterium lividum]
MTDFATDYAARHGLTDLRAVDPAGFAAAFVQTADAGAAMPRPPDKESGPAPIFRPVPQRAPGEIA